MTAPTPREKILALVSHCDWHGVPWPPRANICKAIGISRPSLDRYLNLLRDDGTIYLAARGVYRVGAAP